MEIKAEKIYDPIPVFIVTAVKTEFPVDIFSSYR